MPKNVRPKVTKLDIWVLGWRAYGRRVFPAHGRASDVMHLRRCLQAGLVEAAARRGMLRLTAAGRAAVDADLGVARSTV